MAGLWPGGPSTSLDVIACRDVDARHKACTRAGRRPDPSAGHDLDGAPQNILVSIHPTRSLALARFAFLPITLPVIGRTNAVDCRRARDAGRLPRIEHHHWFLAVVGLFNGLPQQPAIGADRLVRGAEMLAGAVLDRTHRLAGPLVVHVDVGSHARKSVVLLLVRIEAVI